MNMTRRAILLLPLAVCCRAADPAQEVIDLVADAAGSLSAGNVVGFLKAFDPAMAGYAKLRENVIGLIALGDVQSLIDPGNSMSANESVRLPIGWVSPTSALKAKRSK